MSSIGRGFVAGDSTSRSLLAQIKANDADAWNRLVTLYAPCVVAWCRRWSLRDEDIADVFQEVFRSVAAKIGSFRKERAGDTFRGWLRTITRNKVYDHFRRLQREPQGVGGTALQIRLSQVPEARYPDDDSERPSGCGHVDDAEQLLFRRALERVRTRVDNHTWQAFWRTAVDGQSPKDVADELSMSQVAVRVAKSRVLKRLREELCDLKE